MRAISDAAPGDVCTTTMASFFCILIIRFDSCDCVGGGLLSLGKQ